MGEKNVIKAVINFIEKNDDVMLNVKDIYNFEFGFEKDLADRIMKKIQNCYASFIINAFFQFKKINYLFESEGCLINFFL